MMMDKQTVNRIYKLTRLQHGVISTQSSTTCGRRSRLGFLPWDICKFSALLRRTSARRVLDSRLATSIVPLNRRICATCSPRCIDISAFPCPSCDNEQPNVPAHAAAAKFLLNFRTHQICLSYTDSDDAILQQDSATTHISHMQLITSRNLLDLDFFFNFREVASNAMQMFLQMFVTLPLVPWKFCRCFTEQTSPSLVFQRVACDTIHHSQVPELMRCPGLLCFVFDSIHSFEHFRPGHFGGLCNCNMNFITNWLFTCSSCSFEACLLEVLSVSALFLPVNLLLCKYRAARKSLN